MERTDTEIKEYLNGVKKGYEDCEQAHKEIRKREQDVVKAARTLMQARNICVVEYIDRLKASIVYLDEWIETHRNLF